MLSFPYKLTEEVCAPCPYLVLFLILNCCPYFQVDLVSAIRDHASSAYSQSNDPDAHPDALAPEAKKLQDLQKDATFLVGNSNADVLQPSILQKMVL